MTTASSVRRSALALDWQPTALLLAICLLGWPWIGNTSTWLTLTLAGLAMGMIVFTIASGLGLVFGLMDVMNFAHGAFVALGAFVGASALALLAGTSGAVRGLGAALLAVGLAAAGAMVLTAVVGLAFERIVIRPVYGLHLRQILVTMGGLIVGEETVKMIWGAQQMPVTLPEALRGALVVDWGFASFVVERLRLLAACVGIAVFAGMAFVLTRTKLGLLIRAGVQDREMVEALGYRIRRVFVGVFMAGCALAGLGGVLWGLYQQSVIAQMGSQLNILVFLVIIVGGMGSTRGVLLGSLLIGLVSNYAGFLAPKLALFSNIIVMVAVLMWRPRGLHPLAASGGRS